MNVLDINDNYINELPNEYKRAYLDYKRGLFDVEPWGSHQPLLIHLVNTITEGSVIELGMGDNSTPLLHLLCEKLGRKLFSYDFDNDWYLKYKHLENDFHKLFWLDEKKFFNDEYELNKNKYSIVLIDSHPTWTRQYAINYFMCCADYLIVHDTLYINKNGEFISDNDYNFGLYKNVLHFNKVSRVSTFFTNKEITEEIMKIFN